ncbi:hypothetical protein ACFE04_013900 [Oxalis oulophora]
MDRVLELKSLSSFGPDNRVPLFPSPITPAYAKLTHVMSLNKSINRRETSLAYDDDVEDACRSFENYLVEMIVEEGKVQDLMDVEELLQCWKHLKCPVYVDLVCRFYAELCKDLFAPDSTDED